MSGNSTTTGSAAAGLAPEALTGVRTAQEALEREAERLHLTDDPTAPGIAAQASAVKALHRLMVDLFLKVQAQQEEIAKLIQEGRKPWTRDEMRTLVTQMRDSLLHLWVGFNRWGIAVAVAGAVLFGGACGVGGYWLRGAMPALAGLRAGPDQCQDQPNGGRLCYIPVWERLPAK